MEALPYVDLVMGNPLSFFTFDFTACGKSEGTYSSVGWFEQDDLDCVLNFLYGTGKVTRICLWGRSMGATTALLYIAKNPKVECMILDSGFSNFKKLIKEIAKKKASIPGFLTDSAFNIIRKTIEKKANFDINDLRPIDHASTIKLPALFGAAKHDDFVPPQHTHDLFLAYKGEKSIEIFEGDHNSLRPLIWLRAANEFLKKHLLNPKLEPYQTSRAFFQDGVKYEPQMSNTNFENPKKGHVRQVENRSPSPGRITPRTMQFSWLKDTQSFQSFPIQSQRSFLDNTLIEENFTQFNKNNENSAIGSPSNKTNRFRGNTVGSTSVTSLNQTDSPRKGNSKIFSDSYFTSALKSEPDELDSEKSVLSHRLWQHDNTKGLLGPKLISLNTEAQKPLERAYPASRLRVDKGPAELTRSISLTSKGWVALDGVDPQKNMKQKEAFENKPVISVDLTSIHHSKPPLGNNMYQSTIPTHRRRGQNLSGCFIQSQFNLASPEKDVPIKVHSTEKEIKSSNPNYKSTYRKDLAKVIHIKFDINAPIIQPQKNPGMPLKSQSNKSSILHPGYHHKTPSVNFNSFSYADSILGTQFEKSINSIDKNFGSSYQKAFEERLRKPTPVLEHYGNNRNLSVGNVKY